MENQSKLRIITVGEVKEAKDKRQYFAVELRGSLGSKSTFRNIFSQFRKDPKTGLPTQEQIWDRGSREEFLAAKAANELISGSKETHTVQPYKIPGSDVLVSTYSTIVFSDEKVESVFAQSNHPILDVSTGQLLDTRRPKAAAVLSQATENEVNNVGANAEAVA